MKGSDLTQLDALLDVCDEASVWRAHDGEVFATVPIGGHVEHHAVHSSSFRSWLLYQLASRFTRNGRPASVRENSVRETLAAAEARCLIDNIVHERNLRVAAHDGEIIIDCGDDAWSALQVSASGYVKIARSPIPILRGKRTSAFAVPAETADFAPLRELLGHLDEDDFILLLAWCLSVLLPTGPYPILVLGGEQGSGKSTLARLIQKIVDPVHGDLLQPPRDDRDLVAAAKSNRLLAFDNLSSLNNDLADSLCRISTGSEIGGRALFKNHELASFSVSRPIVINGIPDLASRADVADRAIVLRLPALPRRRTEAEWLASVEHILPTTFAGLLRALSSGLRKLDTTTTPDLRMADFARFVVAAESDLPWPPGAFLAAYRRNREQYNATLVEFDTVACAVRDFAEELSSKWCGLTIELYHKLSRRIEAQRRQPDDWPGNPRWFSDRLRRSLPVLRSVGIDVRERRTAKGRLWIIQK